MDEQRFVQMEAVTDPFLQALNDQDLPPARYAFELLKQHTLNRQQILAVAPIVWSVEQIRPPTATWPMGRARIAVGLCGWVQAAQAKPMLTIQFCVYFFVDFSERMATWLVLQHTLQCCSSSSAVKQETEQSTRTWSSRARSRTPSRTVLKKADHAPGTARTPSEGRRVSFSDTPETKYFDPQPEKRATSRAREVISDAKKRKKVLSSP